VRNDLEGFLQKLIAPPGSAPPRLTYAEKVCASCLPGRDQSPPPLSGDEMARLSAELLSSSNPFACLTGRPIIVDIKHPRHRTALPPK